MIGFNRRFDPSFASLQRAHRRRARSARSRLVTILSRDPAPPPSSYIARSGGLFRDMMIHDLDMARFLLGEEPVEVHRHRPRAWSIPPSARPATSTPPSVTPEDRRAASSRRSPTRAAPPTATTSASRCTAAAGLLRAGNQLATTVAEGATRRWLRYPIPVLQLLPEALHRRPIAPRWMRSSPACWSGEGDRPRPATDGLRGAGAGGRGAECVGEIG